MARSEREGLKTDPIYAHKKYNQKIQKIIDTTFRSQPESGNSNIKKFSKVFMQFPNPFRYLLVIKALNDKTWRDQREYTTQTERKVKDKNGKEKIVKESFWHKEFYSYRQVDMQGYVVDMKEEKIVWDGLSSQNKPSISSKIKTRAS